MSGPWLSGSTGSSSISASNSTTTGLAANGVFTGTAVNVVPYTSVTVVVFSGQASATNGLSIQQSSDGTNWDVTDTYTVSASSAKNIGVLPVLQFFRIVYTNGGTLTATLRIQTILHSNQAHGSSVKPVDTMSIENDMEQQISVQMLYNGTSLDIWRGAITTGALVSQYDKVQRTYSSAVNIAAAATATDIATITGSATTTVYITKVIISGIQTTAGLNDILLVKRSTANTLGTSTPGTVIPHDSADTAAVATVLAYTANPTTGTAVGSIRRNYQPIGGVTSVVNPVVTYDFGDKGRPIVLRGITQVLAVNLNGATLTGGTFDVSFEWYEI